MKRLNRTSSFHLRGRALAFTFPETVALVGVMALMAGLATQLLLMAHGFSARIETQQSALQNALMARVQVGQWAESIHPVWWGDVRKVFTSESDALVITENPGGDGPVWRISVVSGRLIAMRDGGERFVWGPFEGLHARWWTKDSRVLGLSVEWTGPGGARAFQFPWGSRPL